MDNTQQQNNSVEIQSVESSVDTSFFYTSDKYINSLDNERIFLTIQSRYSEINANNTDSTIKKNIAFFLNDEQFVQYILDYYGLTIYDLFKLLYKQYGSLFKGPYIKKIKKVLANKQYAKLRRTTY